MTIQIGFVLFLIFLIGSLLITEKMRPDLGALFLLVILGLTGLVGPEEMFSGFSRTAVITILSLFIITQALEKTGAVRFLGNQLNRMAGQSEARAILVVMTVTALLSLVMNTIAAAAVLLPAIIGISRQSSIKPSKLLIPLSFAALLGGMSTIYTTANILVSSGLAELGYKPFGVFDFAPVGVPMGIAGILFMVFIGRHLLPSHGLGGQTIPQRTASDLSSTYHLMDNVSTVYIMPGSDLAGRSLAEAGWGQKLGLNVVGISRGGNIILAPSQSEVIIEGDNILFSGQLDEATASEHNLFFTQDPDWKGTFVSDQISLVEVMLAPRSSIAGSRLSEIHFREKYDLSILAIWREGKTIREKLADIPLKFGDTLLLQGQHSRIEVIRREPDFLVLEEDIAPLKSPLKTLIAVALTFCAVLMPVFNILSIAEAAFSAAVLMMITGCITIDEAYASIDWKTIFLIAGMLPLSFAISNTGTAAYISRLLTGILSDISPLAIAAGLFLLTTLLTQIIPGQATAVILTPIAVAASQQAGADPRGMAIAVAMGCSMAFLTPFGHATNILVMSPGGYTVKDYTRIGLPLTIVLSIVMLIALKLNWQF